MAGNEIMYYPRPIVQRFPRPRRVPYPKKPTHRSECRDGIRPCPFVSCRYHLYGDVVSGVWKEYFEAPWLMPQTCALDLAEKNRGMNLDDISYYFDLTRERIRQIIDNSLRTIRTRKLVNGRPINDKISIS